MSQREILDRMCRLIADCIGCAPQHVGDDVRREVEAMLDELEDEIEARHEFDGYPADEL